MYVTKTAQSLRHRQRRNIAYRIMNGHIYITYARAPNVPRKITAPELLAAKSAYQTHATAAFINDSF
jgi:hypothetical protein